VRDGDGSRLFYEPLVSFDPEGNLVPVLAAEVPTVQNGRVARDGLAVTRRRSVKSVRLVLNLTVATLIGGLDFGWVEGQNLVIDSRWADAAEALTQFARSQPAS